MVVPLPAPSASPFDDDDNGFDADTANDDRGPPATRHDATPDIGSDLATRIPLMTHQERQDLIDKLPDGFFKRRVLKKHGWHRNESLCHQVAQAIEKNNQRDGEPSPK